MQVCGEPEPGFQPLGPSAGSQATKAVQGLGLARWLGDWGWYHCLPEPHQALGKKEGRPGLYHLKKSGGVGDSREENRAVPKALPELS